MRFLPVENADRELAVNITYQLLVQRPPEANISHQGLVTIEEHREFFDHHPYRHWFLLMSDKHDIAAKKNHEVCVGTLYISQQDEIGIFIFREHQRHGHARNAVLMAITRYKPQKLARFVANVAPKNQASIDLFTGIGAFHIQNTYALPLP